MLVSVIAWGIFWAVTFAPEILANF